eukprot:TRINITY_DN1879_c0_g1_i1.p1 TRINITY_DN1879_c0_g1~~TRINITY_DN1879_c0_g1_i1.p1  ORF type:complete len:315 (+),score=117.46 TRINITY_DN1879_c0_g1_i1:166-1110(+)
MQNRLGDLKGGAIDADDVDVEFGKGESKPRSDSVESAEEFSGMEGFMTEFFEEVTSIKTGMTQIRKNIRQIEEVSSESLMSVGNDPGTSGNGQLEQLIESTNVEAGDVRNKLKEMDVENKKMGAKKKNDELAQHRIRTNVHSTLTKKFLDLMQEYQEVQTKYKNKYKERVERQYKIVKPDATQAEIDEALESGNTQVFADKILDKQRHTAAKEALAFIENKHREILALEQSINELHQLFLDMAILVEAQGEIIDQIAYNVEQSVTYTAKGVDELRKANKYAKKSRKKICCLIIILLIVLAIIGGVVGGIFGTRK